MLFFALVVSLALTACGVHTRIVPAHDPQPAGERTVLEPGDRLTLAVERFASGHGWWITATQDVRITRIPVTEQHMEVVQTVTFVPSVLIGLIQCPLAGLAELMTGHSGFAETRRFGCWRLLGQEPVAGTATYIEQREGDPITSTETRPAAGVSVVIGTEREILLVIGPTDASGRLALSRTRLHRAMVAAGIAPDAELRLDTWPDQRARAVLPLSPDDRLALSAPLPPPLPASALPHPFVVAVHSQDPALAAALETLAWHAGWCVAASDDDHAILREELRRQLIDAGENRLSAGQWQAPTVRLQAERLSGDEGDHLAVTATAIGSQRVLASVTVQADQGGIGEAWAVVSERFRQVSECE